MKKIIRKKASNTTYSLLVIFQSIKYIILNPSIWIYVILPFLINIILSILLLSFIFTSISNGIEQFLKFEFLENHSFVYTTLKGIGFILSLLISIWIFLVMGMIVTAPFAGVIVEKVLDENSVSKIEHYKGVKLILFEIWRALKFTIIKTILAIFVFIFTLLVNTIPVIGSIIFVSVNYIFNFYINILDLTDPSLARLDKSFIEKTKHVWSNIDLYIIFGVITVFLFSIPVINFIYLPIASLSATFLFVRSQEIID